MKRNSLCPEQKFEENGFLKNLFSFYHFRTLIEKQFGWFSNLLENCQNCILGVQRNRWCECTFYNVCLLFAAFRTLRKIIFRTFVRRTPTALSKLRSGSKKKIDKNVFQTLFFCRLRSCANFYWSSDRILSPGSSKLNFTCPGEHFKGSLIWWKSVIFFLVLHIGAKTSPMLSKLYSSFPEEFSDEFFQKCYGFCFFGLWAKFLGFHRTFFYRIVKTAFYVFRGLSWDKGFFKKNCIVSIIAELWAKRIYFSSKNSDNIVKIAFHMSRESFWGLFYRKCCACSFLWYLVENCLNFPRKTSDRFLKMELCVSRLSI